MAIMALDHVRDMIHADAMLFSPTDLTRTTTLLFFTRWITHFCAPVFSFTAGMGAHFLWRRGGRVSRFLWTRGLWLILLEVTVMRVAYNFSLSMKYPLFLLVLWVLGACMIVLAALVHLPPRVLAVISVATILLHNCLDGIPLPGLHQPGAFPIGGFVVLVGYPLIPWFAVMSAGFCAGELMTLDAGRRQRLLLSLGAAMTVAFVAIRAANRYGDPVPSVGGLLSFLNTTKYPPSLDFLLMTLGPGLVLLALFDRWQLRAENPLAVLGRVPLFYFVTHFLAAHALIVVLSFLQYGTAARHFIFNPVPSMGAPQGLFPAGFGYPLWAAYVAWITIVAAIYPLCRWFDGVKQRRRDWWLSYL